MPHSAFTNCARIRISMTGRLGLRLRLNQSIGANRRGGPGSDHPAAVQRAARPRKSLCSDVAALFKLF